MPEVGRPTVMTDEVLAKLEQAYLNDATDIEACAIAGISPATLYNYQKANPDFIERKEALKSMINYRAKEVIISKINEGDDKKAEWWLERKGKNDGFSTRTEMTGADGKDLPTPILANAYELHSDNSNQKDNADEVENPSDSRGNVSIEDDKHTPLLDTLSTERQEPDTH